MTIRHFFINRYKSCLQSGMNFAEQESKTRQQDKLPSEQTNLQQCQSSSSDEVDHYATDSPLPKAKPMDLKALWLGDTDKTLEKFNIKLNELRHEQKGLREGLRIFEENENKYRLSSLRKIQFKMDRKKLYDQYMMKTRKTVEKLNPALVINILCYTNQNLFLALTKMRRVSKIFNQIYMNESIQFYLAEKDYLFSQDEGSVLKKSIAICKRYVKFYRTFLYYKEMHYSEQIPQNSIKLDLEEAVSFVNEIHRLVLEKSSRSFTYYEIMNNFMKRHRVVIGLSSLSLTSLVMVRKAAIIAFSNYLAFNQQERSKQEITKTKYSKVISVVEHEDYRDSLIINTKVSNYLWDNYGHNFAVLITSNMGSLSNFIKVQSWNILVYHLHNEQKALYLENIELQDNKYLSARLDLSFTQDMQVCTFATIEYVNWVKAESVGKFMNIITSPLNEQTKSKQSTKAIEMQKEQFSYCFFYPFEQYYVITIPNQFS